MLTESQGEFPELSNMRSEIIALRDKSTGAQRSLLSLLNRQLLTLEKDPDRPGMRELAMKTIRQLANA